MKFKFSLLFVVFALFSSCNKTKVRQYQTLEGQAQGTTFRIIYEDSLGQNYQVQVDSLFKVIDKSMSLWDSTSLISKVNANQEYDKLDPHFLKVYNTSKDIYDQTGGYFDITVGPLVRAWGFSFKKGEAFPTQSKVDSLMTKVGFKKIGLSDQKIVKSNDEINIDFNAIAQGYTVDVMAEFLNQKGVSNYLVEVGGEIRASGLNAENHLWKVGIEKPQDERALEVVVALNNQSLATSGSYRKFFEKGGKRYSHAIDPFTGFPVDHNLLSISVIAPSAILADGLATAFLVMGLEKTKVFAEKNNIEIFAIYEEAGKLKTYASSGLKKMIIKD
jgi:FAD:protein FMN transferase